MASTLICSTVEVQYCTEKKSSRKTPENSGKIPKMGVRRARSARRAPIFWIFWIFGNFPDFFFHTILYAKCRALLAHVGLSWQPLSTNKRAGRPTDRSTDRSTHRQTELLSTTAPKAPKTPKVHEIGSQNSKSARNRLPKLQKCTKSAAQTRSFQR